MPINICKGKDCGATFTDSPKFTNKDYCPICVCTVQSELISEHIAQHKAILEVLGPDFIQNLVTNLDNGKSLPVTTLPDGRKALVIDTQLYRNIIDKGAHSEQRRRNRNKKKSKKKRK